jgi:hypothetical protein
MKSSNYKVPALSLERLPTGWLEAVLRPAGKSPGFSRANTTTFDPSVEEHGLPFRRGTSPAGLIVIKRFQASSTLS